MVFVASEFLNCTLLLSENFYLSVRLINERFHIYGLGYIQLIVKYFSAVQFRIDLDTLVSGSNNKRVEFRGENGAATDSIRGTRNLPAGNRTCWQYDVFVKVRF